MAFKGSNLNDLKRSDENWAGRFDNSIDETQAVNDMNIAMNRKIEQALKKSEMIMVRAKKKTTYVSLDQNVHLGSQSGSVDLQKMRLMDRLSRWANYYPWINLRKMTVMWKTGVSNNVKWDVKMSFVDRRDNNEDTRELFLIEFPVCDNFVMMMAPGYTAYMPTSKGRLPWRFDFEFPEGEFQNSAVFGTLKIKLEIDQYREATQVEEIRPIVKFTQVAESVDEPTVRWMSKGKWYQSRATNPTPEQLATIEPLETLEEKCLKLFTFLGFDKDKLLEAVPERVLTGLVHKEDLILFEHCVVEFSKKYQEYVLKYQELIRQMLK